MRESQGERSETWSTVIQISTSFIKSQQSQVTLCSSNKMLIFRIENWHKLDMSCGRVGGYMDDNDKDHMVVDSRNTIPNWFFVKTRFLFLDMVSNA